MALRAVATAVLMLFAVIVDAFELNEDQLSSCAETLGVTEPEEEDEMTLCELLWLRLRLRLWPREALRRAEQERTAEEQSARIKSGRTTGSSAEVWWLGVAASSSRTFC